MAELPESVKSPEISIEEKYRKAVPALLKRIKILYKAIYEKFGKEGLDLIEQVSRQYGEEIALRAKPRMDKKDVISVGKFLLRIFEMVGGNNVVTHCTRNKMSIRVDCCPYPFEQEEICKAHTAMEAAVVEKLNPKLEYKVTKSIPAGDSYCEHVVRRKPGKKKKGGPKFQSPKPSV